MPSPSSCESNYRAIRIGRIMSDLQDRRRRGEFIDEEQILAENADLTDDLRPHLATLQQLQSGESSLTRLLRQGILLPSSDPHYLATFGDYQIIDYIGHGGMGVVLKAFDEQLRRIVAIKLLRNDLADHDLAKARFLREARAAAALSHPNIVSVFVVGEHDGSHFIAMEYVDGPSLSQVIRKTGPLSAETIRTLFAQLLQGLAAAHGAGLIHRDIKSANLLLENGRIELKDGGGGIGTLKIADFGLARITTAQTRLTIDRQCLGTPEYMSPEQARGDEDIDHRTDLYSAGVVLYEMLTGRTPFRADSPSAVVRQIIDVQPADPLKVRPEVDPVLSSLAMRLMSKCRDDRLGSADAVLETARSRRRILMPWRQRRLRWRNSAWLLICILLMVVAVWSWRQSASLPSITDVQVSPEDGLSIEVCRGLDAAWTHLASLPAGAGRVREAVCFDMGNSGRQVVLAGANRMVDGGCLFGFFDNGAELQWSPLDLTSPFQWPDCAPTPEWLCKNVAKLKLADGAGELAVVVAQDPHEYATRISLVDPRSGSIEGSFWHWGHIARIRIEQKFFADGSPAIIAVGRNNKLDGFHEPQLDDPEPLTQWEEVSVVFILHPCEILAQGDGLGPPHAPRINIPPHRPFAYAFLNMSINTISSYRSSKTGVIDPTEDDVAFIEIEAEATLDHARFEEGVHDLPWFTLAICRSDSRPAGTITVNRHLEFQHMVLNYEEPEDQAFWKDHWVAVY